MATKRITLLERDKPEDVTHEVDDGMVDLIEDDIGVSDYDLAVEEWPGTPDIPLPEAYIWREPTRVDAPPATDGTETPPPASE